VNATEKWLASTDHIIHFFFVIRTKITTATMGITPIAIQVAGNVGNVGGVIVGDVGIAGDSLGFFLGSIKNDVNSFYNLHAIRKIR